MPNNCPWGACIFTFKINGTDPFTAVPNGRVRWARECLIAAGAIGCTLIDTFGPRWSAYVHKLQSMGIPVERYTELHNGPFAGNHARYVLRATVTPYRSGEVAA